MNNNCVRLRAIPSGSIAQTDLELCSEEMPVPDDGQFLVKNLYASIDPTHRIWMSGKKAQYMDPVPIGDVMRAATVGVIVESKNEDWPVGKKARVVFVCWMWWLIEICADQLYNLKVHGFGGIQEYFIGIPGATVLGFCKCEEDTEVEPTFELSFGGAIIGLTAWHGTNKIIEPEEGSIFVVSGGAGAVGSIAGQLAKLKGATVIGIAGGKEKCDYMKETLGFDYAIDYKSEDINAKLKEYAPDGINGYFDNVGGDATEAVLMNAANGLRIALCGSISGKCWCC